MGRGSIIFSRVPLRVRGEPGPEHVRIYHALGAAGGLRRQALPTGQAVERFEAHWKVLGHVAPGGETGAGLRFQEADEPGGAEELIQLRHPD